MQSIKKHPEYEYLDLLREIIDHGIKNVDRGTGAVSYSLFGRQTRYDLSKGFPLLTTKKVYWKGVLHELYWFMSGNSNIKYLVDNNVHIWDDYPFKIYKEKWQMENGKWQKGKELTKDEFVQKIASDNKFAKKWGELRHIYGESWRRWPTGTNRTIDQLKWVVTELTEDPDARNAIVTSWDPKYLYTMALKKDANRFPICHNMYQVSQKDGKLYLQLYQRSADMFLGVPFNIASYALLTIILARVLKLEPGEFIHTFGDCHIYENHLEQVKEQLKRKPRPLPTVTLDKKATSIDNFRPEHVILENYDPHPSLKGELTIAGGLYQGKKKKK
ncbi:MAG: thymidylate synthase [Candidatus Levybacteria bacterium]|nr:thymidylate synthase [Candidatus Levybacteria bacterium]